MFNQWKINGLSYNIDTLRDYDDSFKHHYKKSTDELEYRGFDVQKLIVLFSDIISKKIREDQIKEDVYPHIYAYDKKKDRFIVSYRGVVKSEKFEYVFWTIPYTNNTIYNTYTDNDIKWDFKIRRVIISKKKFYDFTPYVVLSRTNEYEYIE